MAKRQIAEKPKDPWPDVLAAVAAIQKGHEIGRTLLKQLGDYAGRGKMEEAARAYGYNTDAVRKLRQFAATYDDDDLAELCELCRKHERAFGVSFVYRLVAIRNKDKRAAFQRRAISEHWGHTRFVQELRRRFKLGHKRGRQPKMPEDVTQALAEIEEAKQRFVGLLKYSITMAAAKGGRQDEEQRLHELAEQLLAAIEGVETPPSSKTPTRRRSRTHDT